MLCGSSWLVGNFSVWKSRVEVERNVSEWKLSWVGETVSATLQPGRSQTTKKEEVKPNLREKKKSNHMSSFARSSKNLSQQNCIVLCLPQLSDQALDSIISIIFGQSCTLLFKVVLITYYVSQTPFSGVDYLLLVSIANLSRSPDGLGTLTLVCNDFAKLLKIINLKTEYWISSAGEDKL